MDSDGNGSEGEVDLSSPQGIVEALAAHRRSLMEHKAAAQRLIKDARALELAVRSCMRTMSRKPGRRRAPVQRAPTGFARPSPASSELVAFLGRAQNDCMEARTEATKTLCDYIKREKLQDESDRRLIHPNEALRALLGTEPGETVTYFTLPKLLNKHFG